MGPPILVYNFTIFSIRDNTTAEHFLLAPVKSCKNFRLQLFPPIETQSIL